MRLLLICICLLIVSIVAQAPVNQTTNQAPSNSSASAPGAWTAIPPRGVHRTDAAAIVSMLVLAVVGVAYCFWGYRLYETTLFIAGFFVCASIARGALMVTTLAASPLFVLLISMAAGFLGGLFFVCCAQLGIILIGALAGMIVAHVVLSAAKVELQLVRIMLYLMLSMAGGLLVQVLQRPIIIGATSLAGAFMIVFGVDVVLNIGIAHDYMRDKMADSGSYWELGAVAGVAMTGIVFQSLMHRGAFEKRKGIKGDKK